MTYAALCAEHGFNPKDGMSLFPGKFEGESVLTFHFFDLLGTSECLSAMQDGAGDYVELIPISDEDRALFAGTPCAIAARFTFALVAESEQGFASCELLTDDGAAQVQADYESNEPYDDERGETAERVGDDGFDGHPI